MKHPDRSTVSSLDALPNVGPAIARDLLKIGISHPGDLIGMDPFRMYDDLCTRTGVRQDPCVLDTFMSVVHFMEGGEPLPWWFFTTERKKLMILQDRGS